MEEITKLSIIIVNYKNQHLITQCIQSIIDCERQLTYEIIVVDNNSLDNSEEILKKIYPKLVWIQMGYNSGFGRANNRGILESKGENILLLNSDIIVTNPNTLGESVAYYENLPSNKKYVLGIRLLNKDKSYQPTLRLEFPKFYKLLSANPIYILFNRSNKKNIQDYEAIKVAHNSSREVAWINGAFLLMHRSSILEHQLLFDNDFFLYGEDIEWCWRVKGKNFKFYHWHEPEITHIGSASMPNDFLKRCQVTVSDWLMIRKTKGRIVFFLYLLFEIINLISDNFLFFLAKNRGKQISELILSEAKYRKAHLYLIGKYGVFILARQKMSNKTSFYTNCYEDSFLKKSK